jgi:hypothetical protein
MLGYTLIYTNSEGEEQNVTVVHSSTQLVGLRKFNNYTLTVGGYCNQGMGPQSLSITCSTLEDCKLFSYKCNSFKAILKLCLFL